MKFAIERTISHTHKDRVIITTNQEDYFKRGHMWDVKYMLVVLVNVTKDFDLDEKFNIVQDTDSIQYRPKGVFGNSKGYFYKNAQKRNEYLTKEETDLMLSYMSEALEFIKK